ncbi:MAG: Gfo/Idh/MocA family oxidoreductase [Bacteroidales bacterium]|jgi:predicted dehydrogenase|nr:Gfo/Idh/MocA family oxidoreductase [Bacteroidales bacterium]
MKVVYEVGVIGCGYWGPNLVRNFMQMKKTNVARIADLDPKRLEHIKELYPTITPSNDYRRIIEDPAIDIVAIATPVKTHFKFAAEALAANKHVFVEKPIAASTTEAKELIELAAEHQVKLMVGHTFLYTGAVRKMKEIIDSGELGDIYYINSQRLNLGLFQQDINVVWDLAPHDLSIILYLLGKSPLAVSAAGTAHINPRVEDVATVTLYFENDIIAFVQSSWLDPDKIRRMTVVGSKKMMVYDDLQPSEKIRIYNKFVEKPTYYDTFAEFPYSYKYGDIVIPMLAGGEPIRLELEHLVECIEKKQNLLTDGQNGLQVIRLLEAANESLENEGRKVPLED